MSGTHPAEHAGLPQLGCEEFGGKRVVVTGAAGLIGGWIADAFAASGARLLLTDSRRSSLDEQAGTGRWAQARELVLHPADLRDPESLIELSHAMQSAFGAPDMLINNAGIYPHGPLLELDAGEWTAVLEINLTAPFLLLQHAARLMIGEGVPGSIVNIASGAAVTVQPGGVAYSVSKAGLAMLTRGAALELAPHRIRVNAVAPGFAPGSEVSQLDASYVATMTSRIPLGRTSGPADAPSMVLFLCSRYASFVTGTIVHVDGGRVAGASAA